VIELIDVSVAAGGGRLDGLDLCVPAGAFGVLMGRTGCGKTTLLETVCGLKPALAGRIRLHGRDVTAANPPNAGSDSSRRTGRCSTT
jgi:ABC-type sugar transport system ATPase subunit